MIDYEEIIQLIDQYADIVNFAPFGSGTDDLLITKAQEHLHVIFPPSYVWWLQNYGGGEVLGDEIFSLYESIPDAIAPGEIIYVNELNRAKGFSDKTQLVIQENDQAQMFYFDLLNPNEKQEYPVYMNFSDSKLKYAEDFLGFLKRRILDK